MLTADDDRRARSMCCRTPVCRVWSQCSGCFLPLGSAVQWCVLPSEETEGIQDTSPYTRWLEHLRTNTGTMHLLVTRENGAHPEGLFNRKHVLFKRKFWLWFGVPKFGGIWFLFFWFSSKMRWELARFSHPTPSSVHQASWCSLLFYVPKWTQNQEVCTGRSVSPIWMCCEYLPSPVICV